MVLFIVSMFLVVFAVHYVIPITNRFFALIWEDPTEVQRKEVMRRLKELHVDGHIPEEAAVLLASKEYNSSERDLLNLTRMVKPAQLRAMLNGRKNIFQIVLDSATQEIYKNSGPTHAKRRQVRDDEDSEASDITDA